MSAATADPLRLAVLGVTGRMGRALIAAIDEVSSVRLTGAAASASSRFRGLDVSAALGGANRNVPVAASAAEALLSADVVIDFTLPQATAATLEACVDARRPLVIGTTGHEPTQREQIARAAERIPIVAAPNMSLGVNLLLKLVELAAGSLDEAYDIEVFEAHHRNKQDAPSGTALALGRIAARARGTELQEPVQLDRSGARGRGEIGFSVFRGGDVVGDHTVAFAALGERIELTHRASDRLTFARGAVKASQWVHARKPGLYSMQDVLGLDDA